MRHSLAGMDDSDGAEGPSYNDSSTNPVRSPRTTAVEKFVERAKADAERRRMENQARDVATASNSEAAEIAVATSPASDAVETITRPDIAQLTKEAAIDVTGRIHSGESTSFHLLSFETYNTRAGSKVKSSDAYTPYLILCHVNTLTSKGWAVCPYYASQQCKLQLAVRMFDPKSGGTNSWTRHIATHKTASQRRENGANAIRRAYKLGAPAKRALATAATVAVYRDFRPFNT
jgi:hypothetical protein